MIRLLHSITLALLCIYDYLTGPTHVLRRCRKIPQLKAAAKRPAHLMLISESNRPLKAEELQFLLQILPTMGVAQVTVKIPPHLGALHALMSVAEKAGLRVNAEAGLCLLEHPDVSVCFETVDGNVQLTQRLKQGTLATDGVKTVDLIVSTQQSLQLSGISALSMAFAQLRYLIDPLLGLIDLVISLRRTLLTKRPFRGRSTSMLSANKTLASDPLSPLLSPLLTLRLPHFCIKIFYFSSLKESQQQCSKPWRIRGTWLVPF